MTSSYTYFIHILRQQHLQKLDCRVSLVVASLIHYQRLVPKIIELPNSSEPPPCPIHGVRYGLMTIT